MYPILAHYNGSIAPLRGEPYEFTPDMDSPGRYIGTPVRTALPTLRGVRPKSIGVPVIRSANAR